MKLTHSFTKRAGLAGLLLAFSVIVPGVGPSAAAETYTFDRSKLGAIQTAFTYQDLATARIARVGITPIPIP